MKRHHLIRAQLRDENNNVAPHHLQQFNKIHSRPSDRKPKTVVYTKDIPGDICGITAREMRKVVEHIREIKTFGSVLIEAHHKVS